MKDEKYAFKLANFKLQAVFIILYLFTSFIITTLFTMSVADTSNDKTKLVLHTKAVIMKAKDYMGSLKDTETGQRGYLLTQDVQYLEPYTNGLQQAENYFLELSNLTRDNKKQVRRLELLNKLMHLKFLELKSTIEAKSLAEAIGIVKGNSGKKYMEEIRRVVSEFIDEELTLLADRKQEFNENRLKSIFIIKVSIFASLLLIFFFLYIVIIQRNKIDLWNENKELFRQLEENKNAFNKHAIVTRTTLDGVITSVNDKFIELSGYSKDELMGSNHSIVNSGYHPKAFWQKMYKTLQKQEVWQSEVCNRNKNGGLYWVTTTIVPILDNNSKVSGYVAIRTDITKRKKEEKELLLAKEKALSAVQSKSEFLANMSHEIRTPLNAIMGFIGILKENETNKEKLDYLQTITSSSRSLVHIINDILDFSKIESGKLSIEHIDFNPISELQATKNLFLAKCEEKSILLHTDFEELPESLTGDSLRIKQVVNNLISNAIKFTPQNHDIYLNIKYENEALYVSVRDEGIGISEEYMERIFEEFTQADASTTRQYGGTGLGLSISYNLVKLMGGELHVKSKLGVGSEFYFNLPLKQGSEIIDKTAKTQSTDFSNLKILLVEDNKANQLFMKVIFKQLKITFDIANDGLEAIEQFKDNKYDVILMDENMPNMNGIKATQEILKLEKEQNLKHTRIIALTANALKGDRERFLDAGMDDYLTKPLDKGKLVQLLSNIA